jgi:hypothetical protein
MSLSISATAAATAAAQPANTPAPAPAATDKTSQTQESVDAVILSQSAQVIQLNLQGQQPQQIALALGISVSKVISYLGISASPGT